MLSLKVSIPKYLRVVSYIKRSLHVPAESIVIASAVRTPWGKYQCQLTRVNALYLGQMAAEAAVKQSAVPLEQIQQIYMAEKPTLHNDTEGNKNEFSSFLKKIAYKSIATGDEINMESLLKGLQAVKSNQYTVVIVGGLGANIYHDEDDEITKTSNNIFVDQSCKVTENYVAESRTRYLKSQAEGLFDAELLTIAIQQHSGKKQTIREINQDEVFPQNYEEGKTILRHSDGASALVLTTLAKAQELKLTPLAVINDFECIRNSSAILPSSRKCLENLFAKTKLDPYQIQHWEIEDSTPQLIEFLKRHFDLNLKFINPHGGSLVMGHSVAASVCRLLTHLVHSLNTSQYGCMVSTNSQQSLALIIRKLPLLTSPDRIPRLSLYTKDPCPLCDMLVEELELNFSGEYELEKIFIDTKENVRFLRLYRHDIPVVFLNKQFLCMHRLNHRLLRRKLDLLKNKETIKQ